MPAGRPCKICQDSTKARQAAQLVASGLTDEAVGKQLGVSRAAAQRHRTLHIVAPARALVQAAAKDAPAKEKRAEILAAAEAGDPTAFVELAAIVSDLKKVHQRLERTADAAEEDNQRLAVASLSSQQLRAAEVRAKIGGVGSYAPQKGSDHQSATPFSIVFNFGDGRTERIDATPINDVRSIDMAAQPSDTTVVRFPEMLPVRTADEADDEFGEDV